VGSVGIGIAAPAALFHVSGATASNEGIAQVTQTVATNQPTLLVQQTVSGGNANVNQGLVVKAVGTSDGSGNTLHVYQRDGSTTGLVVKGSGKVGIGTNPTARLYVVETANNAWALQVKGTGTSANYGLEVNCSAGYALSSQPFKVETPSGGPFFIDGNGNVGIGDGSPDYKLEVAGTLRIDGTSSLAGAVEVHSAFSAYQSGYFKHATNSSKKGAISTGGALTTWPFPSETAYSKLQTCVGNASLTTCAFPSIHSNGGVGVIGVGGTDTGGRQNIGVLGYQRFTQDMSTNTGNYGFGGYFMAKGLGACTDFKGHYVGVYGRGDTGSDAVETPYGTVTGGWFQAEGKSGQTTYGIQVAASSGSTNYAIRSTAGEVAITGGSVGIGTTSPGYLLEVNGSFAATSKSFVIDHPLKPDHKLEHGALEGPEFGVYHRGRAESDTITLPDYWSGLVRDGTITVQLTPNGSFQHLYVVSTSLTEIKIGAAEGETIDCYYVIYGERADLDPLVVEKIV
jgi:hypothetical protein